jgi:Rod binding domain-containing protein
MTNLIAPLPAAPPAVARPVQPPRPSAGASPAAIAKSARDFEAMAIGQLLRPMFDTVKTADGPFGGGAGEEAWRPLMVDQIAKAIAAHGGLGLAKPIQDALERMQKGNAK